MDFIFTISKLCILGLVVLFLLNFLAELFSSLEFDLFGLVSNVARKALMLFLLFLALVPLFAGIFLRNGAFIFVSIIALFLVLLYAKHNLETDIQKSKEESTYIHSESSGLSKVLLGLGLGYFVFGNDHNVNTLPPRDFSADDNHWDEHYQDDVDPDFDPSDSFDYDGPDD